MNPRIRTVASCCVAMLLAQAGFSAPEQQLSEAERNYILAETLSRIHGNLKDNPALADAIAKALPRLQGTSTFVEIVKKFGLKDHDDGLLETAIKNSNNDVGVEAAQLIVQHGNLELFAAALKQSNSNATKIVEVLGNLKEKRTVSLLMSLVTDATKDTGLRKMAVHALAQTQEGATQLLSLARAEKFPENLRFTASSELSLAHWPNIKTEAAKLLPLPHGKNTESFPSVGELLKMEGKVANGEKVFFRAESVCSKCHQIGVRGGQVGPNLSEIGAKLGKDAIIEAILDPSAGISMGFETFNVTLKNGDEAYGLIASETPDELAIKDLNGIVTHYKKSDIARRDQLKTSIMPAGLQQTMTTQEFVDLVEFLASCKKADQAKSK